MKSAQILVLLVSFFCSGFVMGQLQYNGTIKDAKTKSELPYVNIGVLNKAIGTVTDEEGRFILAINRDRISLTDTLQISSIGYKTIKKAIGDLNFSPINGNLILMSPDVYQLIEIVVSQGSESVRQRKVGFYYTKSRKIGYWRGFTSLGAEMTTKIRVNKRPRQLNEFSFYVLKNISDSLLLRVNVYKGDTPYPETKLTKKNMIFTLKKKLGKVSFDLTPYEIYVNDDFNIGLELLEVYGNSIGLTLSASDEPGTSFRRYASQDEWKRFRNDALMFEVNTTIYEKDDAIAGTEDGIPLHQDGENIKINSISGIVFNNGIPLENVDVRVEGKNIITQTDEKGRYSIYAELGDVIVFDFLEMETVTRKVLETTFGINVSMETKVTELDGVTVTERKKLKKIQEQLFVEYNSNPNLIKTGFGILDKEISGIDLYVIGEEEFRATSVDILEAISGKFPGIRLGTLENETDAVLFIRGSGSILNPKPAVYEIDGILDTKVPRHIDMNNVTRIAILPGLAAAARYGTIAAGGIIVINTKAGNYSPKSDQEPTDRLQVRDNIYSNDAISRQQVKLNYPTYLQELYACESYNEAKQIFTKYAAIYSSSSFFFIDAYLYFKENWKSEGDIHEVIFENTGVFSDNVTSLKALAYVYEISGELKRAEAVYKKIFKLRPNHAQSYLDLARNYVSSGADEKAAILYSRYNYLLNQEYLKASSEGPHSIILTEFTNLIERKGKQLLPKQIENIEIDTEAFKGTRIVLDWNDPDANFELQFVNPRNRFFSWSNAKEQNKRNDDQQVLSKEYFIDDYLKGDWKVNVNYKGSKTLNPIYMKATIFSDYGLPSQRNTVKVFRLHLKNVNQQLFELSGNPMRDSK